MHPGKSFEVIFFLISEYKSIAVLYQTMEDEVAMNTLESSHHIQTLDFAPLVISCNPQTNDQ